MTGTALMKFGRAPTAKATEVKESLPPPEPGPGSITR